MNFGMQELCLFFQRP